MSEIPTMVLMIVGVVAAVAILYAAVAGCGMALSALPLGFYRRIFPRLYAQAEIEHATKRQRELDQRNWEWVMGPDPFTKLPKELRNEFNLELLLGGEEVQESHEHLDRIEDSIDELYEKLAALHRIPVHAIGPSGSEQRERAEAIRGPGCGHCKYTGLIADQWQGFAACYNCGQKKKAQITAQGKLIILPDDSESVPF